MQLPEACDFEPKTVAEAHLQRDLPDLSPVIAWLENGCDPKEAAKELRIYQQRMRSNGEVTGAKQA